MASTSKQDQTGVQSINENMDNNKELFPGCTDITEFSERICASAKKSLQIAGGFPREMEFKEATGIREVEIAYNMQADRLLKLFTRLMRYQNLKGSITDPGHPEILSEQLSVLGEVNDQVIDRVTELVNIATGAKKAEEKLVLNAVNRPNPAVRGLSKKNLTADGPSPAVNLLTAKNVLRPQNEFKVKVNNSLKPFTPIIFHKPHAKKSLQESLILPPGVTVEEASSPEFVYPHPYKYEIDQWQPSEDLLQKVTPQENKPMDETIPEYIETESELAQLCDTLKMEKEFAVDLEHHSYRSFQGFTCLMQVSTRTRDFIVDAIALRSELHILNEVFADPNITKVFHGANSDILWLQRDFGLYVVNMFDTGQAARVLNCARFSLAHLLQVYCQVEADKQFQLSDWRIRPLHPKLLRYAQEDTHHLLYIYDRMRNELIDRGNECNNLLMSVYERSKSVCLRVYCKPLPKPDGYMEMYRNSKKVFNPQQQKALKDLYIWREEVARNEDESILFVLPNHMLLQLADVLPREPQGVLACCNPIPYYVRLYQRAIHEIITKARATGSQTEQVTKKEVVMEPTLPEDPQYRSIIPTFPHDVPPPPRVEEPMDQDTTTKLTGSIPVKTNSSLGTLEQEKRKSSVIEKRPFVSSGSVPVKTNSSFRSLEVEQKSSIMKKRPDLLSLGNIDRTAGQIENKLCVIQQKFCGLFYQFLPQEQESENEGIPAFVGKDTVLWRLKDNTGKNRKRKSDVDLNNFAPEYVPPSKRQHVNALDSTSAITATTRVAKPAAPATTMPAPPPSQSSANGDSSSSSSSVPKTPPAEKQGAEEDKEAPLSSNQMMKKQKKEKKAKQKALLLAEAEKSFLAGKPVKQKKKEKKLRKLALLASAQMSSPENPEQSLAATEKKKKKKKKSIVLAELGEPTSSVTATPPLLCDERKKKKKKEKLTVSFAEEPEVRTLPSVWGVDNQDNVDVHVDDDGEEKKKTKKKKNKKKVKALPAEMAEEVEEKITPFDYSAADKSSVTGKVKKTNADVFNPNLKKKNKLKGKKRFGAKQRKSSTFSV